MKKKLLMSLLLLSNVVFANYLPEIDEKLSSVRASVNSDMSAAFKDVESSNKSLEENKKIQEESNRMMVSIPLVLYKLETEGDNFFSYDLYVPNTEYATKLLKELNILMTTDSRFWKRKYQLSQKSEIELTEAEKTFLGRASFPRVNINQHDLKKYIQMVNKLSIIYESLLKIEKIEVDNMPRTQRKEYEARLEIISKTWSKELQTNQDIQFNWSKVM